MRKYPSMGGSHAAIHSPPFHLPFGILSMHVACVPIRFSKPLVQDYSHSVTIAALTRPPAIPVNGFVFIFKEVSKLIVI